MRKKVIMVIYTEVGRIYHRWYVSVAKHAVGCLCELQLRKVITFFLSFFCILKIFPLELKQALRISKLSLVLGSSRKCCHVSSIVITSQIFSIKFIISSLSTRNQPACYPREMLSTLLKKWPSLTSK